MEGKTVRPLKNSPIDWEDSGRLRAVRKVPGGTVDPGKVVEGLARAAARAGVQIAEEAKVLRIEISDPVRLLVRHKRKGQKAESTIEAGRLLVATNAGSLELGAQESAEPKLTFAIATAPLSKKQFAAIGMASGRPFYTVDLPYLWGRRMKNGAMILGSGLVPGWGESLRGGGDSSKERKLWSGLERIDVRKGEAAERLRSLEQRVRELHPLLKAIQVTHRWCGPILITKNFMPVFRGHPQNKNVTVLGGYSGHGVAQSVYLGERAAEHLMGKRELPDWR
jgi:glycine/D-amino acid oxidase-like deaminating enzyme